MEHIQYYQNAIALITQRMQLINTDESHTEYVKLLLDFIPANAQHQIELHQAVADLTRTLSATVDLLTIVLRNPLPEGVEPDEGIQILGAAVGLLSLRD